MISQQWQKISKEEFSTLAPQIKASLAENQAAVYLAWDGYYELCRLVSGWDYLEVVDSLLTGARVQGFQAEVIYGADHFCSCGQRVVLAKILCRDCNRQKLGMKESARRQA
jgi:hypothetical protein